MKNGILYLASIVMFCTVFSICISCSKDDSKVLKNDAVLKWQGNYENDGCGFLFIINNQEYKAENEDVISDGFKTDDPATNVTVEYELLDKKIEKSCYDSPTTFSFNGIKVISVKKK